MACREATSSCHWLRTWSMASCLVFSDTVATALMVSISARAWESWVWTELSSEWASSSAAVCLFSSSGERWDMKWMMGGERKNAQCDTCVFQTFFLIHHSLLQKKNCLYILKEEPLSVLHLSMHEFNSNRQFKRPKMLHSYVQQDTLHCVEFYDHPHLPWRGKALWTWPASGWTPPPAAAWVWWTRPSPAPELPLAAVAPLNDNEGGKKQNKISCWLHVAEKKSFKSKGKHPQKSVHSLRRLSHY